MKKVFMILAYLSLAATVLAPVLFYGGRISLEANKLLLTIATIVWFVSATLWMREGSSKRA
jgi:hypothetical protein